MIKEIKYGGMSSATSDYESNDGELDFAQNCIDEGNGVESIANFTPDKFANNDSYTADLVYRPVYLHDDRVIVWASKYNDDSNVLLYRSTTVNSYTQLPMPGDAHVDPDTAQFNSIGNTLIVSTGLGDDATVAYFLWRGTYYHALGDIPPMVELFFSLNNRSNTGSGYGYCDTQGDFNPDTALYKPFWRDFGGVSFESRYVRGSLDLNEEEASRVTEAAHAGINDVLATITDRGFFSMPFFVRYAYRLYDGSLTMHSAPVLMRFGEPGIRVMLNSTDYKGDLNGHIDWVKSNRCCAYCYPYELQFRVLEDAGITKLQNWKDIVKSIEIFVSRPIYDVDLSQNITTGVNAKTEDFNGNGLGTSEDVMNGFIADVPRNPHFDDDIRNISTFYHISTYRIDNLPKRDDPVWNVKLKNQYVLSTLTSQEVMTDDYDSHYIKNYKHDYVYNSRHIIANIKKRIYFNQSLASRLPYKGGELEDVWVSLKFKSESRGRILVRKERIPTGSKTIDYIFFPITDCEQLNIYDIKDTAGTYYHISLPLGNSDFLNGSYYYSNGDYQGTKKEGASPYEEETLSTVQLLPNKVYVSEVNNPFVFLPENILTVGDVPITALGVSTQAVSDGQFGQYPFYAFSEDGIWALEVSNVGTLQNPKPISRLVATSHKSMKSIDTEFIFASKKGLYSLAGSTPTLISNKFKYDEYFKFKESDVEVLKGIDTVKSNLEIPLVELGIAFDEYISEAKIAYDYLHRRIFICNANYNYSYVFSINTGWWYTTNNMVFIDVLNSYPEAKVVTISPTQGLQTYYNLVDLSNFGDATPSALITRPLKLDLPDTFKTVDRVIQRGNFEPDHVKQILYGSNDLVTWRPLASSKNKYISGLRGHSYKYFRLALFMNLDKGESLTGCTIQFSEKGTNKLR